MEKQPNATIAWLACFL